MKSAGLVCVRSSGSKRTLVKKSRVWSRAISTMIMPRSKSTESSRGRTTVCSETAAAVSREIGWMAASILVAQKLWHFGCGVRLSRNDGSGCENLSGPKRCQRLRERDQFARLVDKDDRVG